MTRLLAASEIKLGLRLIAKQPVLSLTIVCSLAMGIGLATMAFTLRDALVNGTLPFAGGERFVRISLFAREGGRQPVDLARYAVLEANVTTLEHVGSAGGRPFTLSHRSGELEPISGAVITPRSMRWLPASPLAGRALIPDDGLPGAEPVVLIRESLWKRRYGADPALVGQSIVVNGQPRTVVGVMPDSFEFPASGEIWVPLNQQTLGIGDNAKSAGVTIFGVMRPETTLEAVNAEIAGLSQPLALTESPGRDVRLQARPITADSDQAGVAVTALVASLVLLLLVIASNIATLTLARTWARSSELAVRSALGAARARVVAQLFAEMLVLGSIAAVIGLAAATTALRYLEQTITEMPFWVTFAPNPRVMAFVVALTLMISAVSGLWPALRVTRHDLRNTLQAGRGLAFGGFGRIGAVLLVVEIALSIGLLNGAVVMARTLKAYTDDIPALPVGKVLTVHLGRIETPEMRSRVATAAADLPGVIAAGATSHLPRIFAPPNRVAIEPMGAEPSRAPEPAPAHFVTNGYLEAIGARPIAGRLFHAGDFLPGASPAVVVNEAFVQKFLGGRAPIGRRLRVENDPNAERAEAWREIIGVVPDLGMGTGDPTLAAGFYAPDERRLIYLAIRTAGDPLALTPALRAAVAEINPDLQLGEILPLEEAGWDERQFLAGVASALTAMGGMALLLSIVGIYALLSFMVTRRTREIGVRMALGASRRQVLATIVGGALVHLAIGGAIGTALGIGFVEMRSVILIAIPAPGIWMPLTIVLTLATAGVTACWIPARRALGIRPAEALQAD